MAGWRVNSPKAVLDLLHSSMFLPELAEGWLRLFRDAGIATTTIPHVEALLYMALQQLGDDPICSAGLFDREVLRCMPERRLKELAARFSVALGDSLDPSAQAEAIQRALCRTDFFAPDGLVASSVLEDAVKPDLVYDKGSQKALDLLAAGRDGT